MLDLINDQQFPKVAKRAQMILGLEKEKTGKLVAQELKTYPNKVSYWRKRYIEKGLDGLWDKKRSGRPALYGSKLEKKVLGLLENDPNNTATRIAQKFHVSRDIVWKILRKKGITLQRRRRWYIPIDEKFFAQATDIVGLFLSPPLIAMVLCLNEENDFQYWEMKTSCILTDSAKIANKIKKSSIVSITDAVELQTDQTSKKTKKMTDDFCRFLDEVTSQYYGLSQKFKVVMTKPVDLMKLDNFFNQNIQFQYTPDTNDWLHLMEQRYKNLPKSPLFKKDFRRLDELTQKIETFTNNHGPNHKPFQWLMADEMFLFDDQD